MITALDKEKYDAQELLLKIQSLSSASQERLFLTHKSSLITALTGVVYHMENTKDQALVQLCTKQARWLFFILDGIKDMLEKEKLTREQALLLDQYEKIRTKTKEHYGAEHDLLFTYPG